MVSSLESGVLYPIVLLFAINPEILYPCDVVYFGFIQKHVLSAIIPAILYCFGCSFHLRM